MISLNDVLLAMSNIPVDDPIAEIWGLGLQSGYKIIKYTGSLPITIKANGDALLDYRIYGADGGVGEPTENLFDESTVTKNYYIDVYGIPSSANGAGYSDLISVAYNETYSVIFDTLKFSSGVWTLRIHAYDENGAWIQQLHESTYMSARHVSIPIAIDNQAIKYIRISGFMLYMENTMFVRGTDDISYQPYGYKLPMTVGDGNTAQTVPVYIGENQLTEGEYVSYSEQKIYRDVSGTLTPTDPPVPLPEIPTIDGTTIIDYDGTPKPSQMYVKYKDKG